MHALNWKHWKPGPFSVSRFSDCATLPGGSTNWMPVPVARSSKESTQWLGLIGEIIVHQSEDYVWMLPVAYLVLFGALGLIQLTFK